jgi:hypothetical protein
MTCKQRTCHPLWRDSVRRGRQRLYDSGRGSRLNTPGLEDSNSCSALHSPSTAQCATVESRSQSEHRRSRTFSPARAQSGSSLYGGAESGINRIVVHRGPAPALTRQDRSRKRGPSSWREKPQPEMNNASQPQRLRCNQKDWRVDSAYSCFWSVATNRQVKWLEIGHMPPPGTKA